MKKKKADSQADINLWLLGEEKGHQDMGKWKVQIPTQKYAVQNGYLANILQ